MKRLALFCGVMLLFAGIASAQDSSRAEVFGGYSYVHESDNGQTANFNGGSGSLAYNLTPWFGVVGDIGGYHWSNSGADANVITYLFGPKISYHRGPLTPFGQVLFGGAHVSGNSAFSENAFAMTVGGGVDWNATPHLGIRLVQAEYLLTKFNDGINNRQNDARISTGVVFRF
jgi:outer membrane immunogenic protein